MGLQGEAEAPQVVGAEVELPHKGEGEEGVEE